MPRAVPVIALICALPACGLAILAPDDEPRRDAGSGRDAAVAIDGGPRDGSRPAVDARAFDASGAPDASMSGFTLPFVPRASLDGVPSDTTLVLGDAVIDTDSGSIAGTWSGTPAFFTYDEDPASCMGIGVLAAGTIVIEGHVRASGRRALALIAAGTLALRPSGTLDVSATDRAAGAGGFPGGTDTDVSTLGPGGGGAGTYAGDCCDSGGGGAGHGGHGGTGGSSGAAPGGAGGAPAGSFDRLCGGSGGAAAYGPLSAICSGAPDRGGDGGGGGGAVLVGALGGARIEGIVHAGGAGGAESPACGGGGGGGAGGMIAIAAPTIEIMATAIVAANGGGGGGGAHMTAPIAPGEDGCACDVPAAGGPAGYVGAPGGAGGAGVMLNGSDGLPHANNGGGGGGAVGRIFFHGVEVRSTGAVVSPSLGTSAVLWTVPP